MILVVVVVEEGVVVVIVVVVVVVAGSLLIARRSSGKRDWVSDGTVVACSALLACLLAPSLALSSSHNGWKLA